MDEDNDLDLLWGAEAIADAIDVPTRRAFYLLENNSIPAKKVGGRWVASRRRLLRFLTETPEGDQ